MTDYTVADQLAAVITEVRPIVAGAAHTDTYSVIRDVLTPDGSGGWTNVPVAVETGRCRLIVANRMGGERLSGDRVIPVSLYTAELPIASIVTENDTFEFSGRLFNVTDVKKGGALSLFVVVELEERT